MKRASLSPDYVFLALVGILVLLGLIVLSSASSVIAYEKFNSSFYLLRHQVLFGLLPGAVLFFLFLHLPKTSLRLATPWLFLLGILFLVLVLLPGFGRVLQGSRSWFALGVFSFQPVEFAKLSLILYGALWLERHQEEVRDFRRGVLPFFILVGLLVGLVLLQPDLGSALMLSALGMGLAWVGKMRIWQVGVALTGAVFVLVLAVQLQPYRAARLTTFLHPALDPQGRGYQVQQALLAVGSGGLWGQGFGNSRQKFRYLPEAVGDSIFAIAAEEFGFIFSAGFILMLSILFLRLLRLAQVAPALFDQYVIAGIALWFGGQALVNLGAIIGLLPLTGLPLPFVSYGGSALAMELAAVGIVGGLSRSAQSL